EDVHAVPARVGVRWVDDPGRVADQAHEHAGVWVAEEFLPVDRLAEGVDDALLPGELRGVDGEELACHGSGPADAPMEWYAKSCSSITCVTPWNFPNLDLLRFTVVAPPYDLPPRMSL